MEKELLNIAKLFEGYKKVDTNDEEWLDKKGYDKMHGKFMFGPMPVRFVSKSNEKILNKQYFIYLGNFKVLSGGKEHAAAIWQQFRNLDGLEFPSSWHPQKGMKVNDPNARPYGPAGSSGYGTEVGPQGQQHAHPKQPMRFIQQPSTGGRPGAKAPKVHITNSPDTLDHGPGAYDPTAVAISSGNKPVVQAAHAQVRTPVIGILGQFGSCKEKVAAKLGRFYSVPVYTSEEVTNLAAAANNKVAEKLRKYMKRNTPAPPGLLGQAVAHFLRSSDGAVLIDYPYSAMHLWGVPFDLIAHIDANVDKIGARVAGTRWCECCFAFFHVVENPARHKNKCNRCGTKLQQRKEHTMRFVRHAYNIHEKKYGKLTPWLRPLKLLVEFDYKQEPYEICRLIDKILTGVVARDDVMEFLD